MKQSYLAGMTMADLAAQAGVSSQTIRRRLDRLEIPIRDYRHEARPESTRLRRMRGYDEAKLREMSDRGMTCAEIGQQLGKSPESVRRAMVRRRIPRQEPKARPEHNYFWTGGMTVDRHGYILVKMPGHPDGNHLGYVRQHRLVMSEHLGRPLLPGEVVDHRNDDTSDNRIENLRLFASNGEHLRVTRTGRSKLTPWEREYQRQEAVQRARQRVAAILAESESGAPE